MKKKKFLLFGILTPVVVAATAGLVLTRVSLGDKVSTAEECSHVGNHYAEHDSTCEASGNKEFWACCKCQKQFLHKPAGQWTDQATLGTHLSEGHVAYINPHHFGANGDCADCTETIKNFYGWSDAIYDNVITSKTLGLEDNYTLPTEGHKFITYNFKDSGNFEILLDFTYTKPITDDTNVLFYLFNGGDEKGAVLRLNTNRTEDDGIIQAYIYKNDTSIVSDDLVTGAGQPGTSFYFPRVSGIKSTNEHNYVSIGAELVDASTCHYKLTFRAGNSLDNLRYCSTNAEDQTNTPKVFDVTFGANYTTNYSRLRMSNNAGTQKTQNMVIHYTNPDKRYVNYACDGAILGTNDYGASDVISLPEIKKEGYRFIGWYTQDGEKATNELANGFYTLTARFIETTDKNPMTLSTFGVEEITKEAAGETRILNFTQPAGTTRVDMSFIYTPTIASGDNYVVFGLPYDSIDEKTRVHLRLSLGKETLDGYLYGKNTSFGNPGTDNRFQDSNFAIKSGMNYLTTISFICEDGTNFTFKFSMVNLSNGAKYELSKDGNYTGGQTFDFTAQNRNHFYFNGINIAAGSPKAKISTAW